MWEIVAFRPCWLLVLLCEWLWPRGWFLILRGTLRTWVWQTVRQVRSGQCLLLRRHRLSVCTSSLSVRSRRHYLRYRVLCPLIPGAWGVAADILSDILLTFLRNLHSLERQKVCSTTSVSITWRVLLVPNLRTKQFLGYFYPASSLLSWLSSFITPWIITNYRFMYEI